MPLPTQVTAAQMTLANGSNRMDYSNGTFILNDTSTYTGEFSSIICTGKVNIVELRIVGSNFDVRSTYISSPGAALSQGCVITAKKGTKFSHIKTDATSPVILIP